MTALKVLSKEDVSLQQIGRAAQKLLVGAVEIPASSRKAYLNAGIDVIYDRSLADGEASFKQNLPLKSGVDNPSFLADLLRLDPDFQKFPASLSDKLIQKPLEFSLSTTERERVSEHLAKSQITMTPRLNALTAPMVEVRQAIDLQKQFHINNLEIEPTDKMTDIQTALGAFDQESLAAVIKRAKELYLWNNSEKPDSPSREVAARVKKAQIPTTIAGLAAAGIFAATAGAAILYSPDAFVATLAISASAFLCSALAYHQGVSKTNDAYSDIRRELITAQETIRDDEQTIVETVENPANQRSAKGFKISRSELLHDARMNLSLQTDYKGMNKWQTYVRDLEGLSGQNAAELFASVYDAPDKSLRGFISDRASVILKSKTRANPVQ